EAWQLLTAPYKVRAPASVHAPVGCLECRDTGYLGRVGLYELLPFSDAIRAHIGDTTALGAVRRDGVREGMRTLRLAGAQKVAQGVTTLAEVLRVAPPVQD
ncbi:MAG: type II/IV secretion system protein, partial [Gammaproteobacteria bacterium]